MKGPGFVVEHAVHATADAGHTVAKGGDVAGAVGQRQLPAGKYVGARHHGHRRVAFHHEDFEAGDAGADERYRGRGRERRNGHPELE